MADYTSHDFTLIILAESQEADSDNRDNAREAHLFIDKRDGQWEPTWWDTNKDRPRYTFDQTGPIIDQIAGEMEQADFSIKVKPAGGDTTKDDALLFDGMIRNIENVSGASDIYNLAGRNMITGGIDGWQIKHGYVDDDSFNMDLKIVPIANFVDSVWFGPFKLPDASDAQWCVVLEAVEKRQYEDRWPDGTGQSINEDRLGDAYYQKHEQVIVGQLYYIKPEKRTLLLMPDGAVIEETPEVLAQMKAAQVEPVDTRERDKHIVMSRLFDGGGWLNEPQRTVFNQLPVIPTIVNFKISENKLIYRGAVEKLMDPQRVFNYSKSREIEEGALAPRAKYWMTKVQTAGHEGTLASLNTNADPVQHFNVDSKLPGIPQMQGGPQINAGLNVLSTDMAGLMASTAGLFAPNMGDNPGLQSGIAIKRLQDKGDTSTIKYFKAQERAICRTGRILVDAIPVVYDTPRIERIMKEDGSFDMQTLNAGAQGGGMINDVSKGKYDVTCSAGASFQNRQEETVEAITEIAGIDPTIIELGGDILLSNIAAPGMDKLAARKRAQLMQAGVIPFEEMTDEEKQQAQQAAQQPQQPDAATLLAQAEQGKADAQKEKVQVDAWAVQREQDRKDNAQQFDQMAKSQEMVIDQLTGIATAFQKYADAYQKADTQAEVKAQQALDA